MKIRPNPTFTTDAQLTTPGEEALATIRVTWKHKDRAELKTWSARQLAVSPQEGFTLVEIEAEHLDEVIASWDGPVDEDGVAVPYSLAALRNVMNGRPAAGYELFMQYIKALGQSRLKN